MIGIENTKKAIKALCAVGNAVGHIMEDGKISIRDIGALKYLKDAKDVVKIDFKELLKEYKDWDDQEKQMIASEMEKEFDIPQDQVEAKIEDGVRLVIDGLDIFSDNAEFVKEMITFVKSFK